VGRPWKPYTTPYAEVLARANSLPNSHRLTHSLAHSLTHSLITHHSLFQFTQSLNHPHHHRHSSASSASQLSSSSSCPQQLHVPSSAAPCTVLSASLYCPLVLYSALCVRPCLGQDRLLEKATPSPRPPPHSFSPPSGLLADTPRAPLNFDLLVLQSLPQPLHLVATLASTIHPPTETRPPLPEQTALLHPASTSSIASSPSTAVPTDRPPRLQQPSHHASTSACVCLSPQLSRNHPTTRTSQSGPQVRSTALDDPLRLPAPTRQSKVSNPLSVAAGLVAVPASSPLLLSPIALCPLRVESGEDAGPCDRTVLPLPSSATLWPCTLCCCASSRVSSRPRDISPASTA